MCYSGLQEAMELSLGKPGMCNPLMGSEEKRGDTHCIGHPVQGSRMVCYSDHTFCACVWVERMCLQPTHALLETLVDDGSKRLCLLSPVAPSLCTVGV